MRKPIQILLLFIGVFSHKTNAQTITETFGTGANQFSIDFVQIGNPGNKADTTGSPNPAGSVSYDYCLSKYEISRDMVVKANAEGQLGLSLQDMASYGGNGTNRPATGISWNEAAKFVNWLNTSKGYPPAYNFTSSGRNKNISLWPDEHHVEGNKFRNKDAFYFLPSLDEWYKGAYGSPNGTWYKYATGSNRLPKAVGGGTAAGTVVYNQSTHKGPSDIKNAGGLSSYGTMAQNGNVWEWTESALDGVNDAPSETREVRGASWDPLDNTSLISSYSGWGNPEWKMNDFGFRVGSKSR